MQSNSSLTVLSIFQEDTNAEYCVCREGDSKPDGIGDSLRSAYDSGHHEPVVKCNASQRVCFNFATARYVVVCQGDRHPVDNQIVAAKGVG